VLISHIFSLSEKEKGNGGNSHTVRSSRHESNLMNSHLVARTPVLILSGINITRCNRVVTAPRNRFLSSKRYIRHSEEDGSIRFRGVAIVDAGHLALDVD
jgi:hypothetical protein